MKNFKNKIVIKSLSIYKFKKIFKFWFLLMFFLNFKESWVPSRSSKRTNSVSSRRKSNVGHYSDSNLTLYDPKFEMLCALHWFGLIQIRMTLIHHSIPKWQHSLLSSTIGTIRLKFIDIRHQSKCRIDALVFWSRDVSWVLRISNMIVMKIIN
jgi:hypothetical protein